MSLHWQHSKLAVFLVIVIVSWFYFVRMGAPLDVPGVPEVARWRAIAAKHKNQRNQLAALVNSLKQQLAAMSCDVNDLKRKLRQNANLVSISGGWCKNESYSTSGQHQMDRDLAVQLSYLFENQTVASFGDGPGDYKKFLDETKRLRLYDAYDGAPFGPETSGGVVHFLDLATPQYGLPVYDWVLSLEVAEHIPSEHESVFIDNIVRHARTGVVLSWAVPNQDGFSHVNLRPLHYVKNVFAQKGFEVDEDASKLLQEHSTFHWLANNVHVYRRRRGSVFHPEDA